MSEHIQLIGSGRYSIVTSPGILQPKSWDIPYINKNDNDVFKIFYSDESKQDYEDEMKILSSITKIQNYDTFTATVKGACIVSVKDISSEIKQLLLKYNEHVLKQENVYQIIYGFCGTSVKNANLNKMIYNDWLKIIRDFLKGVQIVHQNGIVHRDITPSNVLFDETSKSLKLIDFGIGIDAESVFSDKEDALFVLSNMYMFSPPEFYLAYLIHSHEFRKVNFRFAYKQAFNYLKQNTRILRKFYKEHCWKHDHTILRDISSYTKGFQEIEKEIDFDNVTCVNDMFPVEIAYKSDVFAISILFKYIEPFIIFNNPEDRHHFDFMIQNSNNFNPFKRMSVNELISYIEKKLTIYL
jgi:serine/threonine protein kinase